MRIGTGVNDGRGHAVVLPAEDRVGRNSLLCNNRLLLTIDNEISSGVVRTFAMVVDEMRIASVGAHHDRHVAQKDTQPGRTLGPLVHEIGVERCLIRKTPRATVGRRDVADVAIAFRDDRSLTLKIAEQKRVTHFCTFAAGHAQHRVRFYNVGRDAMEKVIKRVKRLLS